eukprot:Clim_evm15s146 gene=Clim_evmTU15s146
MLQAILISDGAGRILFNAQYTENQKWQPRLLAPLLRVLMHLSGECVGMPIAELELEESILCCCSDLSGTSTTCVIVLENRDEYDSQLGKILAGQTLQLFVQEYKEYVGLPAVNMKAIESFRKRISEALRRSMRPVINSLLEHQGSDVVLATLVQDGKMSYATGPVDTVSVIANLSAVENYANELLSNEGDSMAGFELVTERHSIRSYAIGSGSLLVVCKVPGNAHAETEEHVSQCLTKLNRGRCT